MRSCKYGVTSPGEKLFLLQETQARILLLSRDEIEVCKRNPPGRAVIEDPQDLTHHRVILNAQAMPVTEDKDAGFGGGFRRGRS